jgi:hypothetical protein
MGEFQEERKKITVILAVIAGSALLISGVM